MTSFKALFKQMFGQKRRYADLVLLLQVFAVLFLLVMALWDKSNFVYLNIDKNSNWLDYILSAGMITTPVADVIFLGLLCWQNEKINLSQTWQLAPISSVKMWLTNMFSSFVECIYIFIIQVVLGFLVAMADNLSHHLPLLHAMIDSKFNWSDFSPVIEFLLFLSGLVLVIFTFVSFANFISRVITDFLPFKSTLWARLLIIAILVIVAVYCGIIFMSRLNGFIDKRPALQVTDPIWLNDLCLFAVNFILGILNLILVKRFVEAKGINY